MGNRQVRQPFPHLHLRLGLHLGGTRFVELPLLEEFERRDLGEIEDVGQGGASGRIKVEPRVMIHAEIAHRMGPERQSK